MNLRALEYFVAVADQRHFGRAAAACHVSQPTLSMQIKKLENQLGVQLLERNPQGVTLTATGALVLDRARTVLRDVDDIAALAQEEADPQRATLRIGLFPTLAPYLLPHVVPTIRQRFPDLELLLTEAKTDAIVDLLRRGDLDSGVLALPIDADELEATVLFEEEFVLVVPTGHRLATTTGPVATGVLADESVLLLDDGHCLRDQALAVCRIAGAHEYSDFRSTSLETLRQMVAAGVGITLLPRLAVSPPIPRSDTVETIEFADPVPARAIAMVWRKSSAYRSFLPRLAELFAQLPTGLVRPARAVPAPSGPPAP